MQSSGWVPFVVADTKCPTNKLIRDIKSTVSSALSPLSNCEIRIFVEVAPEPLVWFLSSNFFAYQWGFKVPGTVPIDFTSGTLKEWSEKQLLVLKDVETKKKKLQSVRMFSLSFCQWNPKGVLFNFTPWATVNHWLWNKVKPKQNGANTKHVVFVTKMSWRNLPLNESTSVNESSFLRLPKPRKTY